MKHGLVVDRIRTKSWRTTGGRVLLADDWELTVLTDRPQAEHAGSFPRVRTLVVDELTTETLTAAVLQVHEQAPLSAISTTSELFLEDVAAARKLLAVAGPDVEYARSLRDKWVMKERARAAGVSCADGVLGNDETGVASLFRRHRRCIAKPRRLSGSRGVTVLESESDFHRWRSTCGDASDHMLEEYIDAPMVHIDGVVWGGRLVWQVSQYERPTHVTGIGVPLASYTVDDRILLARASKFLASVIDAWELRSDVFHLEAFWTDDDLVFCEIAGRPGGAGVSEVFFATRGFDLRHTKTLLDFGEHPLALTDGRRTHGAGGWLVLFGEGGGPFLGVDDGGLDDHLTRDVRLDLAEAKPRRQFAGVGLATYTFVGPDTRSVRHKIRAYEEHVRVIEGDGKA